MAEPRKTMTMIKPISFYYDKLPTTWQDTKVLGAILALFFLSTTLLWAGPAYDQGLEAFQFNRLDEAVLFFEQALRDEAPTPAAYRYLGLSYEELGRSEEAISTFQSALDGNVGTGTDRARIALDLGLTLLRAGDLDGAVSAYDTALQLDNTLSSVYLNRANVNVEKREYERAISDYRLYLTLSPDTPQRPQIEHMISLLAQTVEAERVAAEEAERQRRLAEAATRQAEEEERRLAEEQRQNMLSSVLQSLSNAGNETHSYETEGEDISDYNEDLDILD